MNTPEREITPEFNDESRVKLSKSHLDNMSEELVDSINVTIDDIIYEYVGDDVNDYDRELLVSLLRTRISKEFCEKSHS